MKLTKGVIARAILNGLILLGAVAILVWITLSSWQDMSLVWKVSTYIFYGIVVFMFGFLVCLSDEERDQERERQKKGGAS